MTYLQAIQYLESFINYEKISYWPYKQSLKLERIRGFLSHIDNPQDTLRCIHIAGTKGKGSTCAFISYILRAAGYKVGLYTSPHLSNFRERIRILQDPRSQIPNLKQDFEGMISKSELVDLVNRLRPAIENYHKDSKYGPLSFFEVYTALALVYFKEKIVDFAVLEAGLGGRLDATNVVNPLICAITSISYEHTQKLGSTLTEIATEKVGIIKTKDAIIITAPQEKEVIRVIRNRCKEVDARLYEVNKDIYYKSTKKGLSVKGIFGKYKNLKIRLLGDHQLINASVAIGIVEALSFYDINVGIDSIRKGLYNTIWPGRCEVISKGPLVVLDGAQNRASSRALRQTIKENFKYKKLILVLGISKDKDINGICKTLCPLADEIILTQSHNPRAAKPYTLAKYCRLKAKALHLTRNTREAKILAQGIARKEDMILVTGSLFVVGESRTLFKGAR